MGGVSSIDDDAGEEGGAGVVLPTGERTSDASEAAAASAARAEEIHHAAEGRAFSRVPSRDTPGVFSSSWWLMGGGRRVVAGCITAMALAVAGLATPLAVNAKGAAAPSSAAPRTVKQKGASITASTTERDPLYLLLEDGARAQLNRLSESTIQGMRTAVQTIDRNINKKWMPQDVWLIIAWHFCITKGRKQAFKLCKKYLYDSKNQEKNTWEKSFWHWLAGPMRVVGALWVTTYVFDMVLRLGTALELSIPSAELEKIGEFDRGMYAIALCLIAVMSTNHWLPGVLKRNFDIKEPSQSLVITRLVEVAVILLSIVFVSMSFGVRMLEATPAIFSFSYF